MTEPDCSQCEKSIAVADPYCTGDRWYVVYECPDSVCEKDRFGEENEDERGNK